MSRSRLFLALLLTVVAVVAGISSFRASRTEPVQRPLWTKPAPPWPAREKPDFDTLVKLGDTHYDRAEHEQAVEAYSRALTVRDSAYVRTNLGVSLHTLRRSDEALEHFARALELDPAYWKATFNELVILANRKDYAKALERVDRLQAMREKNAEIPPLDDLEAHLRERAAQR